MQVCTNNTDVYSVASSFKDTIRPTQPDHLGLYQMGYYKMSSL